MLVNNSAIEALKEAASQAKVAFQAHMDERNELATLSEEEREELASAEAFVTGDLMSNWTAHRDSSPTGNGFNHYFTMVPAVDRLVTVGHAVSPHADNYYLRVTTTLSEASDMLVMMESKIAQRLFETLVERAKIEGTSNR
jgi:hypothetical protein